MHDRERLIIAEIPRLRRYARALAGDPDAADDLVQDCLERAWSRLHLWRWGAGMRSWLFTIMHNIHANTVRQAKGRPLLVPLEERAETATSPGQDAALDVHAVATALAQLSEDQRAVVLLVGLEGMSYADTARVLRVPIGTVMSRLARGRERLRRLTQGVEQPSQRSIK